MGHLQNLRNSRFDNSWILYADLYAVKSDSGISESQQDKERAQLDAWRTPLQPFWKDAILLGCYLLKHCLPEDIRGYRRGNGRYHRQTHKRVHLHHTKEFLDYWRTQNKCWQKRPIFIFCLSIIIIVLVLGNPCSVKKF